MVRMFLCAGPYFVSIMWLSTLAKCRADTTFELQHSNIPAECATDSNVCHGVRHRFKNVPKCHMGRIQKMYGWC